MSSQIKICANSNCCLIKSIEDDQNLIIEANKKIASEMVEYMIMSTTVFICAFGLVGLYVAIGI